MSCDVELFRRSTFILQHKTPSLARAHHHTMTVGAPKKTDDTRGWKNVIWGPVDHSYVQWQNKSLFDISTKNDGRICVQYLKNDMVTSVEEGVEYFLKNHSPSGVINVEGGKKVAVAGHKFVITEDPKVDGAKARGMFRHCAIDFNQILKTGSSPTVWRDYKITMRKCINEQHTLVFKYKFDDGDRKKGDKDVLLPCYTVNESLHNSLRTDVDNESRCYSISYQAKPKKAIVPALN